MQLRGYLDRSPVRLSGAPGEWPAALIDGPGRQYSILQTKHADREDGRIPLPGSTQQLWSQHKYSVLARDPAFYREIGGEVAKLRWKQGFDDLAKRLVAALRRRAARATPWIISGDTSPSLLPSAARASGVYLLARCRR